MLKNNDFGIYSGGTGGGGGGVQSVTGLNTDNTDPANPIVQISVDGTSITGDGTPGSPLVAPFQAVTTDGVTIFGDGSGGSPLLTNLGLPIFNPDLAGGDVVMDAPGIYFADVFGNSLIFTNGGTITQQSRVVIINFNRFSIDRIPLLNDGIVSGPFFQGTEKLVEYVPSGMAYEFIYNSLRTSWICLNPTPQPTYNSIDISVEDYTIETYGIYRFVNGDLGPYNINLPFPINFVGLELVLVNTGTTTGIPFGGGVLPQYAEGTTEPSLPKRSIWTLVSYNDNSGQVWYIKSKVQI